MLIGLVAATTTLPAADAFGFSPVQPLQLRRAGGAACAVHMAGFGAPSGAKDSKAPKKITGIPKKTLLNYGEIVRQGAKSYRVFARVKGEDKWYEVGQTASTPDAPDAACTLHKRLALEYAADIYPTLKAKSKELELGYSSSGEAEDDIVLVKKEENAAIAKDAHGFLPKAQGAKMGQGLFNVNGENIPMAGGKPAFAAGGKAATINPLGQQVG